MISCTTAGRGRTKATAVRSGETAREAQARRPAASRERRIAGLVSTLIVSVASLSASATAAQRPSDVDPDCLTVTRASAATFLIANGHCPNRSVLTAIELANDGEARCFTKKIRSQLSLASAGAMPHINYQCIEGTPGCSIEVLRSMFPECSAN